MGVLLKALILESSKAQIKRKEKKVKKKTENDPHNKSRNLLSTFHKLISKFLINIQPKLSCQDFKDFTNGNPSILLFDRLFQSEALRPSLAKMFTSTYL